MSVQIVIARAHNFVDDAKFNIPDWVYNGLMNLIHDLRKRTGLTQVDIARLTGTSQSTIAAYEADRKSPSLKTLARIGACLKHELTCEWHETLTREDKRSLAYHRALAKHLQNDPVSVISHARTNLVRWTASRPGARLLLTRWSQWIELPIDDLLLLMLSPSMECRDMRQLSPFAGILTAAERNVILKEFKRTLAA